MNEWFLRIVLREPTRPFAHEHNARSLKVTRPIVEGYFHAPSRWRSPTDDG